MEEKKETLQLAVEGRVYTTSYTKKFRERKNWVAPNPKHIMSYIPGTVLEIFVKEGDTIEAGETLMKYESMKMHNTIVSPENGTIKKINVQQGTVFRKATLLIELA